MNTQTTNTLYVATVLIFSIVPIIFCVLALFVLVYYVRRRYKLYKEINRIPQELLIMESYRNHLKNLKIKCIINNFIIVILVMEFIQNLFQFIYYLPYFINYFVKDFNFSSFMELGTFFHAVFYVRLLFIGSYTNYDDGLLVVSL